MIIIIYGAVVFARVHLRHCRLNPLSPFVTVTQHKSRYSFTIQQKVADR